MGIQKACTSVQCNKSRAHVRILVISSSPEHVISLNAKLDCAKRNPDKLSFYFKEAIHPMFIDPVVPCTP